MRYCRMPKKTRKPRKPARDVNQAAFDAVQHVINMTEDHPMKLAKTKARKRKLAK